MNERAQIKKIFRGKIYTLEKVIEMRQFALFQTKDEFSSALLAMSASQFSKDIKIEEKIEGVWQAVSKEKKLLESDKDQFVRDLVTNTVYTLSFLEQVGEKDFLEASYKLGLEKSGYDNKSLYNAFDKDGYFTDQYLRRDRSADEKGKRKKRMIGDFNSELQMQLIFNRVIKLKMEEEDNPDNEKGEDLFQRAPIEKFFVTLFAPVPDNVPLSNREYERTHKEYLEKIFHLLMIINNKWSPFSDLSQCNKLCYYYALERIFHSNLILSFLKEFTQAVEEKEEPDDIEKLLCNLVTMSKMPVYINGEIKISRNTRLLLNSDIKEYEQMMKKGLLILRDGYQSEKELLELLEKYLCVNEEKFSYQRVSQHLLKKEFAMKSYYDDLEASSTDAPEELSRLLKINIRKELIKVLYAIVEVLTGRRFVLEPEERPMTEEEFNAIIKA